MIKNKEISYPVSKSWEAKSNAMPTIPSKGNGCIKNLMLILENVKNEGNPDTLINIDEYTGDNRLSSLCKTLTPTGLVYKEDETFKLSNEATTWLELKDNTYLAAFFCANVKFTGELLHSLKESPKNTDDLFNVANTNYCLSWETKHPILDRLKWLKALGVVEYKRYLNLYFLTDKGQHLIDNISIEKSSDIMDLFFKDDTLPEDTLPISSEVLHRCTLTNEDIKLRQKISFYIPTKTNTSTVDTVCEYLHIAKNKVNRNTLNEYTQKTYNISNSTLNHFLTVLERIGLINRIDTDEYITSELGSIWLKNKNLLDIVCFIHSKYIFILEIIKELSLNKLNNDELLAIAVNNYNFATISIGQLRKRLRLLEEAKLIKKSPDKKYSLTKRGEKLLELIDINIPRTDSTDLTKGLDDTSNIPEQQSKYKSSLKNNKKISFKDAIFNLFKQLGFNIEHAEEPNYLLINQCKEIPEFAYSVLVLPIQDINDKVAKPILNFNAINNYSYSYNTDYTVIISESFTDKDFIKKAEECNIALIDSFMLEELSQANVYSKEYRNIFSQIGLVNLSELQNSKAELQKYSVLINLIFDCLLEVCRDPVINIISAVSIYLDFKHSGKLELFNITFDDIQATLDILSSPLFKCVQKTDDGYYPLVSVDDAKKIFEFYSMRS